MLTYTHNAIKFDDLTDAHGLPKAFISFRKKRKERKTEKKKEKEKSTAFFAHGTVAVKVLRGKILFWAKRSVDQKEDFFEANPKGLTLTAAGPRASFVNFPFLYPSL
ncbi:MAG: hypothetical protein KBS80_02245 [Bacteroidales bacterium]|nr:hypothetical protein [Candidatus Cryptobacteroides choladohippi]